MRRASWRVDFGEGGEPPVPGWLWAAPAFVFVLPVALARLSLALEASRVGLGPPVRFVGLLADMWLLAPAVVLLAVLLVARAVLGRGARPASPRRVLVAATLLPLALAGAWFGWDGFFSRIRAVRHAGMVAQARRAEPLIAAIYRHTRDHGAPPARLSDLVPRYLDAVPRTGMPDRPEYRYRLVPTPSARADWELRVICTWGMNFDWFAYRPSGEYVPEGGVIERIGAWGYLHE